MKILHKLTYKRDLPFTMKVKNKVFSRKTATLYFIETEKGIVTTEIAPFPGISEDSIQSCEYQFEKSILKKDHTNPHVAFSLFELHFKLNWQGELKFDDILLNGLCQYKNFKLGTHQTLKIKIDQCTDEVIDFLNKKSNELKNFKLRFDGNRQLTSDQVELIYTETKKLGLNVEYFEEPLKMPRELKTASYPFALDESLVTRKYFPKVNAIVFKPTQYFTTKLWEERDQYDLIISSTFDSVFTQGTLLAMAQSLGHKKAHGLDHGHAYRFMNKLDFLSYDDIFPIMSQVTYQQVISKL